MIFGLSPAKGFDIVGKFSTVLARTGSSELVPHTPRHTAEPLVEV